MKKSFCHILLFFFSVDLFPHNFSLVFILSFISFVLSGVPWPSPCPSPSSRPPSRYQSGPNSLPPRAATPTRPPSRPPSRPSRPPSHPSAHGSPAPVSTMPKRMSSEGTIPRFVHVFVCLCLTPLWVFNYKIVFFPLHYLTYNLCLTLVYQTISINLFFIWRTLQKQNKAVKFPTLVWNKLSFVNAAQCLNQQQHAGPDNFRRHF